MDLILKSLMFVTKRMSNKPKNYGFSLTEVLLAVGVLSIGMIFIAGVFPVGIHFATIAAERTTAAIIADEAFAKVRLYGIDLSKLSGGELKDFNDVLPATVNIDLDEFAYPSTDTDISQKKYCWSALCRRVGLSDVQVTVFVSRKIGAGSGYRFRYSDNSLGIVGYPVPVPVEIWQPVTIDTDELAIIDNLNDGIDEATFINDGYTIVDDETGQIYRVLERYAPPDDEIILLDRNWEGDLTGEVWVVPPPVGGGRYPCIAVYQKVIRF